MYCMIVCSQPQFQGFLRSDTTVTAGNDSSKYGTNESLFLLSDSVCSLGKYNADRESSVLMWLS
uniref:Uncharacterized protein n=1 Tax=Anopheles christyi TaxID=43041 RepID=A0A182KIX3_9DIPT